MLKIENTEVMGWEHAIRGMRNPKNSWEKSDSGICPNGTEFGYCYLDHRKYCQRRNTDDPAFCIGPKDLDLMTRLRNAGTDHRKFMRMIAVTLILRHHCIGGRSSIPIRWVQLPIPVVQCIKSQLRSSRLMILVVSIP